MGDYFGKIVVLAPTKEREMSEFKIGDEITCIDNSGVVLTLGKNYIVTGVWHTEYTTLLHLFNDVGKENSYFPTRFILASDIESSATPTEQHVVGISQNEYDEMYDRIELLESLLVDANNRIAELEEFLLDKHKLLVKWICPE